MLKNIHLIIVFVLFIYPTLSFCYSFEPSEVEWSILPEYCKVRYVQTPIGQYSEYSGYSTPAKDRKWKANLGTSNFLGVHHFCAGKIWLYRAATDFTSSAKFKYDRAVDEFKFAYRKHMPNYPLYSEHSSLYAKALYALGKKEKAHSLLKHAILEQPDSPYAYITLATIRIKKEGNLEEGLKVLKRGLKNVGDNSMNIHVYLAHAYIKKKDYNNAKIHSDKAYKLGYKLPGLKRRLSKIN